MELKKPFKVTRLGVILAVQGFGSFLATYTYLQIKQDIGQFILTLMIIICTDTFPTLFITNHLGNKKKVKKVE